jgi:spore coat polysaccharide biosynthesis predicted glycosyltransferase SpsG
MKRNLYIRADGSNFLGLGHLVRSFSVAQYLRDLFEVTFVCREIPSSFKKQLAENKFHLTQIDDEDSAFQQVPSNSLVLLDGYKFTGEYQMRWKEKECTVISIDDNHIGTFYSDLIINQAPGVTSDLYDAQHYTKFALGPEYSLLRLPFLEAASNKRTIDNIASVVICFGGSDFNNLTKVCAEIVKNFKQFKKITIITGSAYNHELGINIESDERLEHYSDVSAKTMATLMSRSDLAIVPASGILFEAIAVGCRVISGYYNDNQLQIYHGFKKLGAFTDAKKFQKKDINNALKSVSAGEVKEIIDGKSPQRFEKLFVELSKQI